jgi:hypothetical protein
MHEVCSILQELENKMLSQVSLQRNQQSSILNAFCRQNTEKVAKSVHLPLVSTLRTLPLSQSATYILPAELIAIPKGQLKELLVPNPLELPVLPTTEPAIVVTTPSVDILLMEFP